MANIWLEGCQVYAGLMSYKHLSQTKRYQIYALILVRNQLGYTSTPQWSILNRGQQSVHSRRFFYKANSSSKKSRSTSVEGKAAKCINDLSGDVKRSLDIKQTTYLPNMKLLLIMPSSSFFYL